MGSNTSNIMERPSMKSSLLSCIDDGAIHRVVVDKRRNLRGGPDELKLTGSQVTYELKLVHPMGETQSAKKYMYVKFTSRNVKC